MKYINNIIFSGGTEAASWDVALISSGWTHVVAMGDHMRPPQKQNAIYQAAASVPLLGWGTCILPLTGAIFL